jgi:hypothetical protein
MRTAISKRLHWKDELASLWTDAEAADLWKRVLIDKMPWPAFWKQLAFVGFLARVAVGDPSSSPCPQMVKLAPAAAAVATAHVAAHGPCGV